MKISIVTPSFNQSPYLGIAVQSVLDQHYPEVEHIVVDNCSTDGTLDVLRSYPHLRWSSQPDHGQSDALNQGLRLAGGDIIGWLNADDRYLPECFQTVAGIFRDRPELEVVFGDFRWVDAQGRVLRRRVISHGFLLDPSYHFAMDYEWFLRMALGGVKFAHVPRYFADFRIHPGSKTTLAAHRQRAEQEKALLALTPGLRRLPPRVRAAVRLSLMGAARAKRTCKKLWGGCYFEMPWRRACSR